MTAELIARALGGRRSGAGYIARCPSHDDSSPSLSLAERGGRVLVRCHAGCDQEAVIAALRERGLWPERERPRWTAADRRAWAEQRTRDEADLPEARLWRDAAVLMVEHWLELSRPEDPSRGHMTSLVRLLTVSGDTGVLTEYRRWRVDQPQMTAALVHAGGRHRDRAAAVVRRLSAEPAGEVVRG